MVSKAAKFFLSLKGSDGKIPILYRPFHELTGNWFWWCKTMQLQNNSRRLEIYR
jgi:beta-mannanase